MPKNHRIVLNGYPFPLRKTEVDELYKELLDILEFVSLHPTAKFKDGTERTVKISDYPTISKLESHMETLKGFKVI